jgi:hypothetical protein
MQVVLRALLLAGQGCWRLPTSPLQLQDQQQQQQQP